MLRITYVFAYLSVMARVMIDGDDYMDIVMTNAGILNGQRVERLDMDRVELCMKINVLSHLWVSGRLD